MAESGATHDRRRRPPRLGMNKRIDELATVALAQHDPERWFELLARRTDIRSRHSKKGINSGA
jgi:hypothetical protein